MTHRSQSTLSCSAQLLFFFCLSIISFPAVSESGVVFEAGVVSETDSQTIHTKATPEEKNTLTQNQQAMQRGIAGTEVSRIVDYFDSGEAKLKIWGASRAESIGYSHPLLLSIANDRLMEFSDRLRGKEDEKEAKHLIKLLGYSFQPEHKATLERFTNAENKSLQRLSRKNSEYIQERINRKSEIQSVTKEYGSLGRSAQVYFAMLNADAKITQKEALQFLYESFVVSSSSHKKTIRDVSFLEISPEILLGTSKNSPTLI
ncbi:hypothetical protein [Marinibactrum halimedae]|uniref:DUF2059 domain-containing protein n=1 Tax=Marinibactrum halimedae TaxID=1444977 RepID=A0AA37T735_9GAMM|nr:hypothetical protein [Marinibactrum halimedae]MCD9461261.1 hypothetical protein [Marinibactrum halimedae]GLS26203.1 hypothetical protein GCM10007877_19180 [Marinibactrum halimedae]